MSDLSYLNHLATLSPNIFVFYMETLAHITDSWWPEGENAVECHISSLKKKYIQYYNIRVEKQKVYNFINKIIGTKTQKTSHWLVVHVFKKIKKQNFAGISHLFYIDLPCKRCQSLLELACLNVSINTISDL